MTNTTVSEPITQKIPRNSIVGLSLAVLLIATWLTVHITTIFYFDWSSNLVYAIPLIMLFQCWLYVGLFIVAHDCMHGSLAPGRPWLNFAIGQLCLGLYAGFSFRHLNKKHHDHHKYAGTAEDPDYHEPDPGSFWKWYKSFIFEYFSWREGLIITCIVVIYHLALGVSLTNIWLFWAIPAMVSSLQLFYFGTYLPHRPGRDAFTDRHKSRTNNYSWIISLLTCFHFGYHHEHHLYPKLPWWKLPEAHKTYQEQSKAHTN